MSSEELIPTQDENFNFDEITQVFQQMQEQGVDPMEVLQQMMGSMGEGEEGEQFLDMMNQLMSAINPEQIAYESTMQIIKMYEDYLSESKDFLSAEEYSKYNGQLELHREVLQLINNKGSQEEFQELSARMNFTPEDIPEPIREMLAAPPQEEAPPGCGGM